MFSLQWPWVFALAPLPLLVRWLLPAAQSGEFAIRVPFYARLKALQGEQATRARWPWLAISLLAIIWLLMLASAARPIWIGEPTPLPNEGRDLMLAVDISGSMREDDMQIGGGAVSRLDAVKQVVGEFVTRRQGDRIGLILFGQQGYLQTPLTFDRDTVTLQLDEALPGFAGSATAIGDAIGLAIKLLRDRPAESRVLILLTDGANTAGSSPRRAAKVAAEAGIRIHTVGVGADSRAAFNFPGLPRRLSAGTDLDEETLTYIADTTGGGYFRARDPKELEAIYRRIDALEPTPEEVTYRPQRSLFHWPLAAALGMSVLLGLARAGRGGAKR